MPSSPPRATLATLASNTTLNSHHLHQHRYSNLPRPNRRPSTANYGRDGFLVADV
eukprot:CAMPEP_0183370620 /NCGR_PEP_ID=MMETSP0164_2-20130417/102995_1 /TAXON_ID=221442 /ORGANISM="Coccolithus pelagicus ssp braarudi, Strain PLY182g" /LENGTH=54 /DNA_ID=CAMNT_0025547065 /DNA_START=183 /DNA_END=347 /DNA_ORIENTATION=+